uniref:Uncharacterized protein n=1 Tax=Cacopsylla melanoneura TaxID=428564 RepID=A0A8D8W8T6_9HEMI
MLFQVTSVALLSFGVLFYYQCSAQDEAVNTNFDLSKVYDMPMSEVQANFLSIIATMKKEAFNCAKWFPKSELITFALTPTHGENQTFMLERWNDMCDYFLDPGMIEHFKLYVLNRFPSTKSTWWGPREEITDRPLVAEAEKMEAEEKLRQTN